MGSDAVLCAGQEDDFLPAIQRTRLGAGIVKSQAAVLGEDCAFGGFDEGVRPDLLAAAVVMGYTQNDGSAAIER